VEKKKNPSVETVGKSATSIRFQTRKSSHRIADKRTTQANSDLAALTLLSHHLISMTDSPYVRAPLDASERPILDNLLQIRTQLEFLKQDKSTYVKSQDVIALYKLVIEQVEVLNEIRKEKRDEQNRGTGSFGS
jgi:hypothetical protein